MNSGQSENIKITRKLFETIEVPLLSSSSLKQTDGFHQVTKTDRKTEEKIKRKYIKANFTLKHLYVPRLYDTREHNAHNKYIIN